MSSEQSSLFADVDTATPQSSETIADINTELLARVQALPQFTGRILVFGEGQPQASVAVIGESPGVPDLDSGRPFMGPAGDMVTRILSAIGLTRGECYLTNTVKMISTGDELTPDVLSVFTPYLHRELAVVRPRIIIASGNTPTKALLNSKKGITQMRGEFHNYNGAQLMPMFNPAYLLRDPTKKREVWEDMKKVRDIYNSLKD